MDWNMIFQVIGWLSIAIGLYGIYSLYYVLYNVKKKTKFKYIVAWLSLSHTSFVLLGVVISIVSFFYELPRTLSFIAIPFYLFAVVSLVIGTQKFKDLANEAVLK